MADLKQFRAWALLDAGYSRATTKQYTGAVRRAEQWFTDQQKPPLRRATPADLREYGETLPLRYSTRSAVRSAILAYYRYAGRAEPERVVRAIRIPTKPQMVCRAIDEEETGPVLAGARKLGPIPYAVLCALYYAALRASEAAALEWSDIEDDYLRVVGKGDVEALIPLHPELRAALDAIPEEDRDPRWVFPGRYPGTHIAYNTVNVWVKLAGAAAGLGDALAPHRLRHTSLAEANDRTGDLRAAQTFARHADPRTTSGYTRTRAQALRALVAALGPQEPPPAPEGAQVIPLRAEGR